MGVSGFQETFIDKIRWWVKFGILAAIYFRKRPDINDGSSEGSKVKACMDG